MPDILHVPVFLLLCLGLDLLLGDPHAWPHPVRLLGWTLNRLEPWAQRSRLGPGQAGIIVAIALPLASAGIVLALTHLPGFGLLAAIYLGYAGLALGCLIRETDAVLKLLEENNLDAARLHLAGLVSRETGHMNASEIRRALGETLAENFNDGFVAPFFWLAFLGPAALWAYKTTSTLDSMWGYRTQRFEHIGRAGARLDDILAFVPARLAALCLWLAGWSLGRVVSWQIIVSEAQSMDSPNAGWPMSAAAYAAQVSMGGPTIYFGESKDKPRLGPLGQPWTMQSVHDLRRVVLRAALICATVMTAVASALAWWSV